MAKTFHIMTYGCQMNENDSEMVATMMDRMGFAEASTYKEADYIFLNTCSIREYAETRVHGKLGELKTLQANRPSLRIAVMGCMPQLHKESLKKHFPYINMIFGTQNIHHLPQLVSRSESGEDFVYEILDNRQQLGPRLATELKQEWLDEAPWKRKTEKQAWVRVMYGCDKFCSFCIVPTTRGKEMSRSKEEILNEVANLDKSKHSEVVLLGQNVNGYGKGLYKDYDLGDLMLEIAKMDGIEKVDFLTSHPNHMTEHLIDCIAAEPKITRLIHLALQSGDDHILKVMNRKHSMAEFKSIIDRLRAKIPGVRISTDLIVGFPGETEAQFQATCQAVIDSQFIRCNTAIFSARPGTPAADLPDQISEAEKSRRLQVLMQVCDRVKREVKRNLLTAAGNKFTQPSPHLSASSL